MIERSALRGSQPQHQLPLMGQAARVILVIVATAMVTFMLYLYVLPNSQMSAANARIAELRARKAALMRQNADLQQQIAEHTDLGLIERRARKLGMGPPQGYVFLNMNAVSASAVQPVTAAGLSGAGSAPVADSRPTIGAWLEEAWSTIAGFFDRARSGD